MLQKCAASEQSHVLGVESLMQGQNDSISLVKMHQLAWQAGTWSLTSTCISTLALHRTTIASRQAFDALYSELGNPCSRVACSGKWDVSCLPNPHCFNVKSSTLRSREQKLVFQTKKDKKDCTFWHQFNEKPKLLFHGCSFAWVLFTSTFKIASQQWSCLLYRITVNQQHGCWVLCKRAQYLTCMLWWQGSLVHMPPWQHLCHFPGPGAMMKKSRQDCRI